MFLGYVLQAGHQWNGEFSVIPLHKLKGKDLKADAPARKCYIKPETTRDLLPLAGEVEFPLKANRVSAAKAIAQAPMTYKDVPVKVVRIRPDFELERDALLHAWAEGFAERHELIKELHLLKNFR